MKRLLLASMAAGALLAAFTPEPIFTSHAVAQAKPMEYLIKGGKTQPSRLYVLSPHQANKAVQLAAFQISCTSTHQRWKSCK